MDPRIHAIRRRFAVAAAAAPLQGDPVVVAAVMRLGDPHAANFVHGAGNAPPPTAPPPGTECHPRAAQPGSPMHAWLVSVGAYLLARAAVAHGPDAAFQAFLAAVAATCVRCREIDLARGGHHAQAGGAMLARAYAQGGLGGYDVDDRVEDLLPAVVEAVGLHAVRQTRESAYSRVVALLGANGFLRHGNAQNELYLTRCLVTRISLIRRMRRVARDPNHF
jgi:hypothetical protein